MNTNAEKPLIISALYESLLTGFIAFVMLGPITGLVLKGFDFVAEPSRPLILAGAVALGKFLTIIYREFGGAQRLFKSGQPTTSVFWKLNPGAYQSKLLLGLFVLCAAIPFISTKYWISVFILALIYVLLGLGLNIVVGLAGLLDLGFVAFYAVGAYGYALGHQYLGFGFWESLLLSAVLAGCLGSILGFPVLRMHGDYLAIVTLGFGEIIRLVLNNWLEFTGGPNGVSAPVVSIFGLEFSKRAKQGGTPFHEFFNIDYDRSFRYIFIYLVLLLVVTGVIFAVTRLKKMPIGRAWEALREDEIACRSLGLNHVTIKLSAFSTGASIGGLAGVFFAAYQGFVNPSSFTFFESALILAVVVLGGLGSTVGVTLAALILTILPEMLREFSSFRILFFGILMVVMMIWRPRGLIKMKRPKFRLGGAE